MSGDRSGTLRQRAGRRTVLEYAQMLAASSPRGLVLALVLRSAVVAAEGLAIVLLVPLLRLAGVADAGADAGDWWAAADGLFHTLGPSVALPAALCAYAVAVTGGALLERQSVVATMQLQEDFLLALRRRLFRAMTGAEWKFLARCRGAELTHALTAELERLGPATYQLLTVFSTTLSAAVCFAIAVRLSVAMTLFALATGGLLLAAVRRRRRTARAAGQMLADTTAELFAAAAEHVGALKGAKICHAEARSEAMFDKLSARVATLNVETERLHADGALVFGAGSVLVLCAALYVGLTAFHLDAPTVLVLLYLFSRLTPRLASAQGSAQNFLLAMPAFASVVATIRRCEQEAECASEEWDPQLRRDITLDDVRFQYPDRGGAEALRGVTLRIEAGRTTAIVGPSGAGKSTIADIVMGLLAPDAGTVRVDGLPLTPARARPWRSSVGYVAQDVAFLHDTVRANLLWAAPEASDQDVTRALGVACARDFVERLPRGLDAVIGDRGVSLSGGERQRLALARAILRPRTLIILDEATSAVDAENEARIQRAVESLRGEATILLITHRLATVRSADFIYVVEDGRVTQAGTWDDLLCHDGRFASLHGAQGYGSERSLALG